MLKCSLQKKEILNDALALEYFNITEFLINRHIREGRKENIAIKYQDKSISYGQLSTYINQTANYLSSIGVSMGDRVCMLIEDTPAFPVVFFAATALGAIVVPVNPSQNVEVASYMLENVGAELVIVSQSYANKFQNMAEMSQVINYIVTGDFCDKKSALESTIIGFSKKLNLEITKGVDLAYCLFSSGTTGKPKGIMHRHRDFLYCAKAYAEPILSMSENDTIFAVSKLTFGYALSGVMLFSFIFGAKIVLMPEQSTAENVVKTIRKYMPTLFLAQPRLVSDLLQLSLEPQIFKSIKTMVTAGEVLSKTLYQRWRELYGIELLDGFGSTEVGHIFISNHRGQVRENSLGKALTGYTLKIVDNNNQEVPEGKVGRLCIKGESLTPFYWNRADQTQRCIQNGWFYSEDLFIVKDNYYYFAGRADEMIKTGCGEWINPIELEKIILNIKEISDCAVIGYKDNEGVIRLKALIVSGTLSELIKNQVCQVTKDAWPGLTFKHINAVEFVSILPRSENGKLQRYKLVSSTLNEFSYDC